MLEVIKKTFSPDNTENTDAAKEAISDEMNMAMMQYMPLRGALSFGGGMVSQEMLAYLLSAIPAVGVVGIWWSVPIGWFLADMTGLLYFKIRKNKLLPLDKASIR